MEIVSTQKFIKTSPKKLRYVAGLVKKLSPLQAVEVLPFAKRRAKEPLIKVIKTAIGNAKSRGVDPSLLVFKEIQIGEGPRLKRGRPVSRGRWHPYKRRMSHIRIVLQTKQAEAVQKEVEKTKELVEKDDLKTKQKAQIDKKKVEKTK